MLSTKIPPPIVTAACATVMWWVGASEGKSEWQLITSTGLLAIGLGLMLAAVISFVKHRTTVNPMRPMHTKSLITTGIFSRTRNPIYLGDLLLLLAWAVWLGNPITLLVLPAFIFYINRFQIEAEENAMKQLFGAQYQTYCNRVRRWL
jgi:protein-S-isoprenylcysteine O-methyltransferase Ste14